MALASTAAHAPLVRPSQARATLLLAQPTGLQTRAA